MTLKQAPKEFQELIEIDYIQSQDVRQELMKTIIELTKIEDIDLKKNEFGYLQVIYKNKHIMTIIPLRTEFKTNINNIIELLSREQILERTQEIIKAFKVVEILEIEGI